MNRLKYVRHILPKNIEENPDAEFVLMDYGSSDGLEDWIRAEMWHHIETGRLVVYRIDDPPFFCHAHAKNMAHVRVSGDIVCNLDSETLAGKGFTALLAENFQGKLHSHVARTLNGGGRIALSKENFLKLRGYDEDMIHGWGWEDNDFFDRIANILEYLPITSDAGQITWHRDHERVAHTRVKNCAESMNMHREMSVRNIRAGRLVVNADREIGAWPKVIKNYGDAISVSSPGQPVAQP